MLDLIICGIGGSMGRVMLDAASHAENARVVAGIDPFVDPAGYPFPVVKRAGDLPKEIAAQALIDFSRPAALPENLAYARRTHTPLIIATTGYNAADKALLASAAKDTTLFFSANMSLGVNLQIELCKQAASFFADSADVEIIEKHHNRKVDAPSGTALTIAEAINEAMGGDMVFQHGREGRDAKRRPNEIGLHAVRGGSIVGQHEALFITDEEIVEITHRSQSKHVFAAGALRAAEFMQGRPAGLYSMADILYETRTMTDLFVSHGEAIITIGDLPDAPGTLAGVFGRIAQAGVNVDIISQNIPKNGKIDISFSLQGDQAEKAMAALAPDYACKVTVPLAKLTVEGMGMEYRHGVAARLFSALADQQIGIHIVSTSETKISFCVDEEKSAAAIATISKVFGLRVK